MALDKLEPTLAPGHRFDCPICGKPATSYMLNYEKGKQIATYGHVRHGMPDADGRRFCRVPVLHG